MPNDAQAVMAPPILEAVDQERTLDIDIEEMNNGNWFEQAGTFNFPTRGEIRQGKIVEMAPDGLRVDIGGKSEGILHDTEFDELSRDERKALKVGEQISVFIVNPMDKEGNAIVSISRAKEELDWQRAEDLLESQQVFESKITGYNKGGLLVPLGRIEGFLPGSMLNGFRSGSGGGESPDKRWGHLIGQPIRFKVIEANRKQQRLIVSERAAMDDVRKELLNELVEGEIREGRVVGLTRYGAFVDLGGVDGLIHVSELAWRQISHPRDVVQIGDDVKVYILSVNVEDERIGLSLKRLEPDPWWGIEEKCPVGSVVEASITKLTKFGAFARVNSLEGIEGLIHISELSEEHIEEPGELVRKGQQVWVRVIRVEPLRHRLGLSLKSVQQAEFAYQEEE